MSFFGSCCAHSAVKSRMSLIFEKPLPNNPSYVYPCLVSTWMIWQIIQVETKHGIELGLLGIRFSKIRDIHDLTAEWAQHKQKMTHFQKQQNLCFIDLFFIRQYTDSLIILVRNFIGCIGLYFIVVTTLLLWMCVELFIILGMPPNCNTPWMESWLSMILKEKGCDKMAHGAILAMLLNCIPFHVWSHWKWTEMNLNHSCEFENYSLLSLICDS